MRQSGGIQPVYALKFPDGRGSGYLLKAEVMSYIDRYMDKPLQCMVDYGFWNLHGFEDFNAQLHALAKQIIDNAFKD
jgi:hypothetical protein